ncbi:uncharacterized protein ARMOST_11615 [Armillaria ostoyae]|uniref:polynucleotide adenylyltransferase n=1 Tax=Armillaria ostoyae TaxID=47428 RepID=A0A284RHM9_ARMOS|nr:uncharacterized protein ARMOST_11615 [Armillaria ostoyae]
MAYTQTLSPQPMHQQYRDVHTSGSPIHHPRQPSKQRFVAELSQCLFDFVIQLLPTAEEMAVKEDVRKLLERLIRTIEPDSRLLSFGSTANGFSLRNSDMDLCCLIDSDERLAASDLVTMLGDLLERETKFHVKPLPHARIPIVKLTLDPSPGLPLGIACDIGFENRLALENTRLLMCYAMIDPTRVRTLVLFLKVWSKRRKINSPYKGTLSSYGYVLLVIYFLVHVKNPPILPNLQQMPPLRPISKEDTHLGEHNTWFFDDIDLLRQRWRSENMETVAELLIDFFRYYSRDFLYNTGVASIRAGLIKKEIKGWQNDLSAGRFNDARERNRFCIEDPFEIDFNVARCVTKDGLYTIRGEFMRASRVLAARPERAILALAELCEERKDEDLVSAPAPRLSNLPPQTPYSVGSQSMRPKGGSDRFSPPTQFSEPSGRSPPVVIRSPPEHMAPKRGKWTSPPPPEAPSADHTLFENQLENGLSLATASTEAREREEAHNDSSSEVLTDEDRSDATESDDVRSVRSYTEGSVSNHGARRSPWLPPSRLGPVHIDSGVDASSRLTASARGRFHRLECLSESSPTSSKVTLDNFSAGFKPDSSKRSSSARSLRGSLWPSATLPTPLPSSPDSPVDHHLSDSTTVYYQTGTTRSPRPNVLYPPLGSHSPLLSQYQRHNQYYMASIPHDIYSSSLPPLLSSVHSSSGVAIPYEDERTHNKSSGGLDTPTPSTANTKSHAHSHSTSTITASTPPSHVSTFPQTTVINSSPSNSPKAAFPPSPPQSLKTFSPRINTDGEDVCSNSSSPTSSSTGYEASGSRSPSPQDLPSTPVSPPLMAAPSISDCVSPTPSRLGASLVVKLSDLHGDHTDNTDTDKPVVEKR